MLKNRLFSKNLNKRLYSSPQIIKIGRINKITLKTGSQPDFSGNFYQP